MVRPLMIFLSALPVGVLADWRVGPVIGFETQSGGDRFDSFVLSDGSNRDIRLGDGVYFYAGAFMNLPELPYVARPQLRTRVGFKVMEAETDTTRYSQTSVPFELGLRFAKRCKEYDHLGCGFFFEVGAAKHWSAQYEFRGSSSRQQDFDSQVGLNLKAGWHFVYLGYTQQTYQADSTEYDASSLNIGIEVPIAFGDRWSYGDVF